MLRYEALLLSKSRQIYLEEVWHTSLGTGTCLPPAAAAAVTIRSRAGVSVKRVTWRRKIYFQRTAGIEERIDDVNQRWECIEFNQSASNYWKYYWGRVYWGSSFKGFILTKQYYTKTVKNVQKDKLWMCVSSSLMFTKGLKIRKSDVIQKWSTYTTWPWLSCGKTCIIASPD